MPHALPALRRVGLYEDKRSPKLDGTKSHHIRTGQGSYIEPSKQYMDGKATPTNLHSASKRPMSASALPTAMISFSSSTSSFDRPRPPSPPSASLLSLTCAPNLSVTRLK